MGYQRLFFLLSLLAHHIPRFFCYLFTTKLFRFKTIVYISSCIYFNFILDICNIRSTTRYHCSWIQTITFNRLQRYLKKWRFALAHLNKYIDIYLKLQYTLLNATSYFSQNTIQLECIWYQIMERSIHGKQAIILHIYTSGFYKSKHAISGTL